MLGRITPWNFCVTRPPTGMFLEDQVKLENLEETHDDMKRIRRET